MADPFDRLLERTLKAEAGTAEPCPSAELLAAYVDGTLSAPERTALERHAADCQICAEHLALLSALEPIGSSAALPGRAWWRTWTWLVPVTASVLVAAVWVALPRDAQVPTAEANRAAAVDRPPADASKPAGATSTESLEMPAATESATTPPSPRAPGSAVRSERTPSLVAKSAPVASHAAPSLSGERRDRPLALPAEAPPAQAAPAAPVATDALTQPSADLKDKADEESRQRAETANTATAAAHETVAAPPPPPAPSPAGAAQTLSTARRAQPESAGFLAKAERKQHADAAVLEATDPSGHRWRIRGTAIEQSTDGGATWHDAHAPVLSGASFISAPAPGVCWVAAPSGDILRHPSDGGWTRSRVPASSAIVALAGTSATEAVATAADQRSFETKDGGLTWVQLQK